jgi:hypothetical protein
MVEVLLPFSRTPLIQIVYGVRERQLRSGKVVQGTHDITWLHICGFDVVVVYKEDAGVLLSLGLPLLMQCDKCSLSSAQSSR